MLSHVIATASSHQSHADNMRSTLDVLNESMQMFQGSLMDHGDAIDDVRDTALMSHEAALDNRDAIEDVHQTAQDHHDALNALHKPSQPVVEHEGHDPNEGQHAHHESHGDSLFGL